MIEQDCADFGCLPSEAVAERRWYEPTARLMDDVRDARRMRHLHDQHTRSETMPAEQCAKVREHLASTFGVDYSRYLLPAEFVTG